MQYDWTGAEHRRRMFFRFGFGVACLTALMAVGLVKFL